MKSIFCCLVLALIAFPLYAAEQKKEKEKTPAVEQKQKDQQKEKTPAVEQKEKDPFVVPPCEAELRLLKQINIQRERYGLAHLVLDRNLLSSARRHCAWMANRASLVHSNAPVAENIAEGYSSVEEVVAGWMGSDGHRRNILGGYRVTGISVYQAPNGRIFWCQQFLSESPSKEIKESNTPNQSYQNQGHGRRR